MISHSPDLSKLIDEGYKLSVQPGRIVIQGIPYVNKDRKIREGSLITTFELSGNKVAPPSEHTVTFTGECPCDQDGQRLEGLIAQEIELETSEGLCIEYLLSKKILNDTDSHMPYKDFYQKMTTYINLLSVHAEAIELGVAARALGANKNESSSSSFDYMDNAFDRIGVLDVSKKLKQKKVAIVGLGGTGSYILDLISKTPIEEIHLFDSGCLLGYNIFRAPGATSINQMNSNLKKVNYFRDCYSLLKEGIKAHAINIDEENVTHLKEMDFVFICVDKNAARRPIMLYLEAESIPFIDVGMGLQSSNGSIGGLLHVKASTPEMPLLAQERGAGRIPSDFDFEEGVYDSNIQIVDLNALNAVLAVIKWKKMLGFYRDLKKEHYMTYTLDVNDIINEDKG